MVLQPELLLVQKNCEHIQLHSDLIFLRENDFYQNVETQTVTVLQGPDTITGSIRV